MLGNLYTALQTDFEKWKMLPLLFPWKLINGE